MNDDEQRVAELYEEFWQLNHRKPNHDTSLLNPKNIKAIAARVAREGVKPDEFLSWTRRFKEAHPAGLIEPIQTGANAAERLAIANGERLAPAPNIHPRPPNVHPLTGRDSWTVKSEQARIAAEKEETARKARNRNLPWHLRKRVAGEDDV